MTPLPRLQPFPFTLVLSWRNGSVLVASVTGIFCRMGLVWSALQDRLLFCHKLFHRCLGGSRGRKGEIFTYLWLPWIFIAVWAFSPALASGDRSPVHGLLTVVASLVEHSLSSCGFRACGIFLGQESNLCLLHWQADSLPLNCQRSLSPCALN